MYSIKRPLILIRQISPEVMAFVFDEIRTFIGGEQVAARP